MKTNKPVFQINIIGPDDLRQLVNELHEVVDWFHLGIQLGVSEYELQMISEAHPRDPARCRTEMLSLWMKTTSELKWSTIVQALAMIGSRTLSNVLAQKYGMSKWKAISCGRSTALLCFMQVFHFQVFNKVNQMFYKMMTALWYGIQGGMERER